MSYFICICKRTFWWYVWFLDSRPIDMCVYNVDLFAQIRATYRYVARAPPKNSLCCYVFSLSSFLKCVRQELMLDVKKKKRIRTHHFSSSTKHWGGCWCVCMIMYACVCMHDYVCVCVRVRVRVRVRVYVYGFLNVCVCVDMCVCVCVYVWARTQECVCV